MGELINYINKEYNAEIAQDGTTLRVLMPMTPKERRAELVSFCTRNKPLILAELAGYELRHDDLQ